MVQKSFKFLRLVMSSVMASLFLFYSCQERKALEGQAVFVSPDFSFISIVGLEREVLNEIKDNQEYASFLQLLVERKDKDRDSEQLPIIGTYQVVNSELRFTPSFRLVPGQRYKVRHKVDEEWIEEFIQVPANDLTPVTSVTQIYPSPDVLPRNLLKFYIQFSDSMAQRFSYQNITLLSAGGDTIPDAFLELEEELWSTDMKRYTLLFDPGRIKRGLGSQDDLGYTFRIGEQYSLFINSNWPDAQGRKLITDFRKDFTISNDDRIKPNPQDWSIEFPTSSTDPLHINFNEPLDYGLINRVITIHHPDGSRIQGTIVLKNFERRWVFSPSQPWNKGNYELKIELILEDLAGNNLKNVFDVDNRNDQTNLTGEVYHIIPFRID